MEFKTGRDTCSRTDRDAVIPGGATGCRLAACALDKGDLDGSPRLDVGGQPSSTAVCFSQWFQIKVEERIHSSKYCASKILGLAKPGQKFGPTRTLGGAILQNTVRGSCPSGSLSCVELGPPPPRGPALGSESSRTRVPRRCADPGASAEPAGAGGAQPRSITAGRAQVSRELSLPSRGAREREERREIRAAPAAAS